MIQSSLIGNPTSEKVKNKLKVKFLSTETVRVKQTLQTLISLLTKEQSDQGIHCHSIYIVHYCITFSIVGQIQYLFKVAQYLGYKMVY